MMTKQNKEKKEIDLSVENGEMEKREARKFMNYFMFFLLGFLCALVVEKFL